jgi:molybdenum cofactor guanylyltransferase
MMIRPDMLLLGGAGRNVGKTEFACEIIRRYSPKIPVVTAKITTVKDGDDSCPRGGQGCGVCSSLANDYFLMEEFSVGAHKDTARMKQAGANRVFWLRVRQSALTSGINAMFAEIPSGTCLVCESNSARKIVEPGSFLVLQAANSNAVKTSCAAVQEHADRFIAFHGQSWDFSPERCQFQNGHWLVPAAASAAILAGGQSRRMGSDKSLLPYRGHTLIEHIRSQVQPLVDELLIGGEGEKYQFLNLPLIPDEQPGLGPLMGILSCLRAARHEHLLVTACDVPELPVDFLRLMLRRARICDIVMASNADDGRPEPLLAVYNRRIIPAIETILKNGGRRIIELLQHPGIQIALLPLPPESFYRNINTPEEYQRITESSHGATEKG